MAIVEKSILIEYSAAQMFDLVENVAEYPKFLPWCSGVEINWREDNKIRTTVHINYHGIKQNFTTENTHQRPQLIEMKLYEGLFKHLDGDWRFLPLGETACKIQFRLHYEFSSKLLETLVGPVFHYIANSFIDAFVKRAKVLYSHG